MNNAFIAQDLGRDIMEEKKKSNSCWDNNKAAKVNLKLSTEEKKNVHSLIAISLKVL